jgi:phosphate transport system substrate-binding protein
LVEIFNSGKLTTWNNLLSTEGEHSIHPYTRQDLSGAAEVWAKYLGMTQKTLLGKGVIGDEGLVNAVLSDPLGLGYCNASAVFSGMNSAPREGIEVLPIDINKNGMIDHREKVYTNLCEINESIYYGKLPQGLRRDVYLVLKSENAGKLEQQFIIWIYSKGQDVAETNGYPRLRRSVCEDYLHKLEAKINETEIKP